MTDIVLSSRQNVAAPPRQLGESLSEVERICNMIASGGEMVPPAYRNKPGAVLLAKMWGDANGVDLFTAIQNISPIEGKPYVSAEMRVAMAVAKGFEFRVIESTRHVCTLRVIRGGETLGEVTCSIGDQPRKLKTSSGKPTPWEIHPDDMLFAETCRKADRRFVRTAAALLDAGQDYEPDHEPEPEQALSAALDAVELQPEPEPEPDEAELIDEPEPATAEAIDDYVSADHLLSAASVAGLSRPRLLKHAQLQLGWSGGTIDDIVSDQHVAALLLAAIGAGEVQ